MSILARICTRVAGLRRHPRAPGRLPGARPGRRGSQAAPRALAAALLLGGLVACAAPPPATAPAALAPSAAGAPAELPRRAVSIGYAAPSASFLPIYVAQEGGIFARHGLDVSLQQIQNNAGMAALVSGELDVYDVASGSLVPAALSGADLVLIASDSNRTIFGLITTPDLAGPADLRGKTLGLTQRGASDEFVTRRYLLARGLDPDADVVLQPVGGIPEKLLAMEVGQISGGLVSPPTLFVALDKGMKLLDRPSELFEYQGSGLVLQRARLQGPDGERLGRALAESHVEAVQAIRADRDLALRALDRYAPAPSRAIAEQTLDWALAGIPADSRPTLEGLQAVIEDVLSARGASAALDPRDLVDLRFLPASARQ